MSLKSLALSCVAMVVLTAATAWGGAPRWVLIDSSPEQSDFYFDSAGAVISPEGVATVTVKVAYTPEGKLETLAMLKNDKVYADLGYTLYSYDLNCSVATQRLISVGHFDSKGVKIREFSLKGKTGWEDIPPDSRMDIVKEQACPPEDEQPEPKPAK